MNRTFLLILLAASLSWGFSQPCYSQIASSDNNSKEQSEQNLFDSFQWLHSSHHQVHEIHFVGGYSFHSTRGFWGKIPEANLQIYGVRYNRKLFYIGNRVIMEYVAEINLSVDYDLNPTRFDYGTGHFSGFGGTPLGFQFNFRRDQLVQPFLKTSTGFMLFEKQFPDNRGTKFNFTLELGGGIEFATGDNISITLGYKYHHMSNFFIGQINPGVDSNIFYTGITIF